jgi:dihydroxyacid dehydratase/phosphogluconate dehydratase
VTGTVRRNTGTPAAGACITIQTASSCAAVADAAGTWRVELPNSSVANVTWNLRFFFSGVESQGISVNGLAGGTRNVGTQTLVN